MSVLKDKNKTNDGRSWYYITYKKDFNGINKKYKSKKYFTKSEAQQAERLFLMKRDNPINKSFILVTNAYFEEMYQIRKESTVYSYENAYKKNIEPYFSHLNINEINISLINNWRLEMAKKGLKITYLNKLHNILKSIFDYAVKNYGLESNPVAIVGRFQKKNDEVIKDEDKLRYISYEDFNKFISVIDNITWKTFFIFLYYTGMRKGEVQALNWNDIDFDKNEITVNKTLSVKTKDPFKITSTKNYINRKIKMSKTLKEQLLVYKNEMMKYTDYRENWFVFGCQKFLPQTNIDRYKNYYFKISGIKPITIHEFRHSHVSLLINEYVKSGQTDTTKFFLMMSDRMGHSIKVMQETYMHLFPTIQNEIVDILDNL
jgi:integrase